MPMQRKSKWINQQSKAKLQRNNDTERQPKQNIIYSFSLLKLAEFMSLT